MATITLYKDKLNGVGGLIDNMIKSVNDLDVQLGALKSTLQGVDSSTYNLQDTIDSIRSSSKAEKEKIEDLKKLNRKVNEFITTTVKRDNSARDEINRAKKDFYTKYSYLKPECEKSTLEKIVDTLESAGEWCAEHWKLIATAIIVVVAVALLFVPGVNAIVAGACWGAIFGAVIGGVSGGLESMSQGGSFWDGFEDGAFSGAVGGAIGGAAFAGLGAAGSALGKGISCISKLGKTIKGVAAVSKVLDMGMSGFDTLALLDMAIDNKNNPIADLNKKLHSSKAYNVFQSGVSVLSVFTGGMTSTMACFVAGTMILTSKGLVAIEKIRAGDMVFSANPDTMERAYKKVLETYVREVKELVHLMIAGEEIVTTVDHPFYVNGRGFINAANLCIGTELVNSGGDVIKVEQIYREKFDDETVRVYNFKVEEFHTYYVGKCCILVHNADYLPTEKCKNFVKRTDNKDGSVTITKKIDGKNVDVTYTKGNDGNMYPRFEPYAHPEHSNSYSVKGMNGNYVHDAALANKAANLPNTPKGYTWHHLEDGKSMILIQSQIHSVGLGGFSHIGGASIIRNLNYIK